MNHGGYQIETQSCDQVDAKRNIALSMRIACTLYVVCSAEAHLHNTRQLCASFLQEPQGIRAFDLHKTSMKSCFDVER